MQQYRFVAQQMEDKVEQFDEIERKWSLFNFYEIPEKSIVSTISN